MNDFLQYPFQVLGARLRQTLATTVPMEELTKEEAKKCSGVGEKSALTNLHAFTRSRLQENVFFPQQFQVSNSKEALLSAGLLQPCQKAMANTYAFL